MQFIYCLDFSFPYLRLAGLTMQCFCLQCFVFVLVCLRFCGSEIAWFTCNLRAELFHWRPLGLNMPGKLYYACIGLGPWLKVLFLLHSNFQCYNCNYFVPWWEIFQCVRLWPCCSSEYLSVVGKKNFL